MNCSKPVPKRGDLFDALLHAIYTRQLIEALYNKVPNPTKQNAQQHVLGSVDWNIEIRMIIEEIENVS